MGYIFTYMSLNFFMVNVGFLLEVQHPNPYISGEQADFFGACFLFSKPAALQSHPHQLCGDLTLPSGSNQQSDHPQEKTDLFEEPKMDPQQQSYQPKTSVFVYVVYLFQKKHIYPKQNPWKCMGRGGGAKICWAKCCSEKTFSNQLSGEKMLFISPNLPGSSRSQL